ncbi:glycoside hydrolase family 43 protein [Apiospora phragmitis]|uniref:Glycoside hydrolase family 43 protein n=1 Tax=Apiospora phragmitis TaxID=2905665 RepID=A0ABR1T378_9PEZI
MELGTRIHHGGTGVQSKNGDTFNAILSRTSVRSGGDIRQVPLAADAFKQDPMVLYTQIAFQAAYIFWNEGICGGFDKSKPAPGVEHKIRVCRSRDVAGLYVDREGQSCAVSGGTTVLESQEFVYGPGGAGLPTRFA